MSSIIIVAETGSDITSQISKDFGIEMVPMHVMFGDENLEDGSFPVEKICDYYNREGKLPTTSGCTPGDFEKAFDDIHKKYPDAKILYLAYSAVTTCSYQSAVIAANGRDYIEMIDTKQVSVGQAAVVVAVAKELKNNPEITMDELKEKAMGYIEKANMCFVPDNLEFLKAGGRVSNVAFLGSRILNIHPCIEILEGKLTATKKYRGKMIKVATKLVQDYSSSYNLDRDCIWFVYTIGLSEEVKNAVNETAKEYGFKECRWIQANGVITTHGGPAAFGLAGFSK